MNTPTRIRINESGNLFFDGKYEHVNPLVPSIEGLSNDDVVFLANEDQEESHGIVGVKKGQYLKEIEKISGSGLHEFLKVENVRTGKTGLFPRKFARRVFCKPDHEFKAIAIPRMNIVSQGLRLETEKSYSIVEIKPDSYLVVVNSRSEMIQVTFDKVDILPFPEHLSKGKKPTTTIEIRRRVTQGQKLDEEAFAQIIQDFQNVVPGPIETGLGPKNADLRRQEEIEKEEEEFIRKKIEEIEKETEQLKAEMTKDEIIDFQFEKRKKTQSVYEWVLKQASENVEEKIRNFYQPLGRYDTPETDRMFEERRKKHMSYFWTITSESLIKNEKIPLSVDESTYEAVMEFFNDETVKKKLNMEIVFREGNTIRIIRKTEDPCYRECRLIFLDVDSPGFMSGPNIVIGVKPMKEYNDFYDRESGKYQTSKNDHLVSTISHETGHLLRRHSFESVCAQLEKAEFLKQLQLLSDLKLMGVTPLHVTTKKCQLTIALSKLDRAQEIEADIVSIFGSISRGRSFIDHFCLDLEFQREKAFQFSLLMNRKIYKTHNFGKSPTSPSMEGTFIASAIEDAKDVFNERDYRSGTHPPHSIRIQYIRKMFTELTKEQYRINEEIFLKKGKVEEEEEEETEGEN